MVAPSTKYFNGIIPTVLNIDTSPKGDLGTDRADPVWIGDKKVSSLAARIDDDLVAVPDDGSKFVAAQILPDVFGRVQFGLIGRQRQQGDVLG